MILTSFFSCFVISLFNISGQIRMASRRNVKNDEKLKKRSFFLLKTLVRELAPIRMMQ